MKYTARIMKIGDSLFVIIPSSIKNLMKVKMGDLVEVDLENYIPKTIEVEKIE